MFPVTFSSVKSSPASLVNANRESLSHEKWTTLLGDVGRISRQILEFEATKPAKTGGAKILEKMKS